MNLLKEQFNNLGFETVYYINLSKKESFFYKAKNLFSLNIKERKIRKIGLKLFNFNYTQEKKFFLVSENNYHLSSELIAEALILSYKKKKKRVISPSLIDKSELLYNLRIYTYFILIDFRSLSRIINKEDFEKVIRDGSTDFFKQNNLATNIIKINSSNIPHLFRQACKTNLPIQICIETNSGCNYRCLMCPYHGGRQNKKPTFIHSPDEMSFDLFKNIVDQVKNLKRPYELNTEIEEFRIEEVNFYYIINGKMLLSI